MTPQPRHLDTAKKLASDHFAREQRGETPIGWKHVQEIAAALAEAENRAAWRGYELGTDWADEYMKCKYDEAMAARDKMSIEYGPRPAKEKQA